MKKIENIDIELTPVLTKLKSNRMIETIVNELNDKSRTILFTLDCKKEDFSSIPTNSGLYLFETKKDSAEEISEWISNLWIEKVIKFTPSIKKKRIIANANNEWIELYLGKCNNVHKRIIEHIFLEGHKQTYALKLKARIKNLEKQQFRIKWFCFGQINEYHTISSILESEIRKRINPIIGRQ